MPKRTVRCPYGGHFFQVEFKEGFQSARAVTPTNNAEGLPGHEQVCPICNRPLFIKYM